MPKQKPKTKSKPTKKPTEDKTVFRNELILGILLVASVVLNIVSLNRGLSKQEAKELQAFESVASDLIESEYGGEDGKSAFVTGFGISEDDDLYADFITTEFEDHIPIRFKKARLHFNCGEVSGDDLLRVRCGRSLWSEKTWTDTSEEIRTNYREYYSAIESYVERFNATEDEVEREKIQEEENKLSEKFNESSFKYWE